MSNATIPMLVQAVSLIGDEQMYRENILDHSAHPHNAGTIPDATFMHQEINSSCGDTIGLYVKLADGKVADVKFDGHGCAISQAAVSMLTAQCPASSERRRAA